MLIRPVSPRRCPCLIAGSVQGYGTVQLPTDGKNAAAKTSLVGEHYWTAICPLISPAGYVGLCTLK